MAVQAELKSLVLTGSTLVDKTPERYYVGFVVSVVTATAVIFIRDGVDNTGAIIDVLAIGTAVGTNRNLAMPIRCKTGIYVDFNGGTGSLVVFYN